MNLIYIDRRKAGKGKSVPNRQRVIRRVKEFVKDAKPNSIGTATVANSSNQQVNPVRVASDALEEPCFVYDPKSGTSVMIVNGNPKYERGDPIDLDDGEGDGRGTKGGPGENGEDDFIINIAADEFLDMFFEDCELPNLTHEKITERMDNKKSHAGYSPQGIPAQMSVIRTYKQALGRRKALGSPYRRELEELEEERRQLCMVLGYGDPETRADDSPETIRLAEIEERIIVLQRKLGSISTFDKIDLRFRKHEFKPLHTVEAVLIMVMDISGSMDQNKKTIARRWFALLYAFIKRRYASCDLVFIAHTEEAMEMSEADFFSTRINGGTMVSPALSMANDIINQRYDSTQTNIYVSHASDGDNWESNTPDVGDQMKRLMSKVQHFSYIETPYQYGGVVYGGDTNLWNSYEEVQDDVGEKMMSMSIVKSADDVYSTFKKIFKKQ